MDPRILGMLRVAIESLLSELSVHEQLLIREVHLSQRSLLNVVENELAGVMAYETAWRTLARALLRLGELLRTHWDWLVRAYFDLQDPDKPNPLDDSPPAA